MPMIRHGNKIGTVMVRYDVSTFKESQRRTRRLFYLSIVSFIFMAIAGAVLSSYWFTVPVRKLAAASRTAGAGNLDQTVSLRFPLREFKSLANDFNEMVRLRKEAEKTLRRNEKQLHALSQKIIDAQDEERNRLGRELHDDFGQKLMTISLRVEALRKKRLITKEDFESLSLLVQSMSEELIRIYKGLKPSLIRRLGLTSAMEYLVREMEINSGMNIKRELDFIGKDDVDHKIALSIYRITQESLTNIIKHSEAHHVRIELEKKDKEIRLLVEDDGRGFDANWNESRSGIGIVGMRERALAIGGRIQIDSKSDKGTQIRLFVPLTDDKREGLT
jgi:signal transduction histidine kinase